MNRKPKRRHLPPRFVEPQTPCNAPVQRCSVPREQASKRILIQRTGAFGDILMGTVLLEAIRKAHPDAHLTWIAEHSETAAIDCNPYIDEIVVWDGAYWKRMVRRLAYLPWIVAMRRFQRELHARRYDVFVSFQPEEWSLLARGNGAAVRVGIFDTFKRYYRATETSTNTRYYTHPYSEPDRHRIDQYLLVLDAIGVPRPAEKRMSLGYTAEDRDKAVAFLRGQSIEERDRFVILVPHTTWPTKCWSADRFVELANMLTRRGYRVVLSGSPKEAEAVEALAARIEGNPVVVAGQVTFREFCAVLDRAALLVSGDTGPMHAAVALRTPYVALFGPTSPKWYGPLTGPGLVMAHAVPCGPCDQKFCPNIGDAFEQCMRLLTVDEVAESCLQVLAQNEPTARR